MIRFFSKARTANNYILIKANLKFVKMIIYLSFVVDFVLRHRQQLLLDFLYKIMLQIIKNKKLFVSCFLDLLFSYLPFLLRGLRLPQQKPPLWGDIP